MQHSSILRIAALDFPNGDRYLGEVADGQANGKGIYWFSSGNKYLGDVVNRLQQGNGVHRFADGSEYRGNFSNGFWHGRGVYHFSSGAEYQGEWKEGKQHGKGVYRYSNGDVYSGDWRENKQHGSGVFAFANGDEYQGDWENDLEHGRGVYRFANGTLYFGECKQGKRSGNFAILSDHPPMMQHTSFHQDHVLNATRENCKDPLFFYQLFGIPCGGITAGYSLGILSDYLLHYFEDNNEILRTVVDPLRQAAQFCSADPNQQKLLDQLNQGNSFLFPFGSLQHGMLLRLSTFPDSPFVEGEVYNSGENLPDYHAYEAQTNTFQLMRQFRFPLSQLTLTKLGELLKYRAFRDPAAAYEALRKIKEFAFVEPKTPVWKRAQKGNNCEIECIFAFLAQHLSPLLYKKLRKDIFQDCLNAAMANTSGFRGADLLRFVRVQKKIAKMELNPFLRQNGSRLR